MGSGIQRFNIFIQFEKIKLIDIQKILKCLKTFAFNEQTNELKSNFNLQTCEQIERITSLSSQIQKWIKVQKKYLPKAKWNIINLLFQILKKGDNVN